MYPSDFYMHALEMAREEVLIHSRSDYDSIAAVQTFRGLWAEKQEEADDKLKGSGGSRPGRRRNLPHDFDASAQVMSRPF